MPLNEKKWASFIKKMAAVFYQDLDIGVLVNNVGMSYEYPQEFLELSSTYVDTLINLNIVSLNQENNKPGGGPQWWSFILKPEFKVE